MFDVDLEMAIMKIFVISDKKVINNYYFYFFING
jgi:hypothetical protein